MIEGRAKNQQVALDLYETLKTDARRIARLDLSSDAEDLAGIAFSLWRAVFLADRSGTMAARISDAENFLGKMLTDNAIGFSQDRSARDWSFSYYIDNALLRLKDLGERNLLPPLGRRTAQQRWNYLHTAFERAVKKFRRKLQVKRNAD